MFCCWNKRCSLTSYIYNMQISPYKSIHLNCILWNRHRRLQNRDELEGKKHFVNKIKNEIITRKKKNNCLLVGKKVRKMLLYSNLINREEYTYDWWRFLILPKYCGEWRKTTLELLKTVILFIPWELGIPFSPESEKIQANSMPKNNLHLTHMHKMQNIYFYELRKWWTL